MELPAAMKEYVGTGSNTGSSSAPTRFGGPVTSQPWWRCAERPSKVHPQPSGWPWSAQIGPEDRRSADGRGLALLGLASSADTGGRDERWAPWRTVVCSVRGTALLAVPSCTSQITGAGAPAQDESQLRLTGTVLMAGVTSGCGGEKIAVQVSAGTGVVGSQFAESNLDDRGCFFDFAVPVPEVLCYELSIESQLIGWYPPISWLVVGVIPSEAVFDPLYFENGVPDYCERA